jgi:uncharacterized delta-60 repeat protein
MNKSPPPVPKFIILHLNFHIMKRILYLLLSLLLGYQAQAQYQQGLDHSFAAKGIATIGAPAIDYPQRFINGALQPDGKIVALAAKNVTRWNVDGSIDNSFGVAGIFTSTFTDDSGYAMPYMMFNSVAVQADAKLLVAGNSNLGFGNILLFRLTKDGILDTTFGKHGVICNRVFGVNSGNGVTLQSDGKIIISGCTRDYYQLLVRYLPNGTIDSTFGTYGKVVNPLATMSWEGDIELLPDGRIIALFDDFGACRYLPNGSLDTTFNHTGMASVFSGFTAPYSPAMAVCPDGKIWFAGYSAFDPVPNPFIIGRLNANGSVDSSLAGTGYYKNYNWTAGTYNKCLDILLQPDGKLILGGNAGNPSTSEDNFAIIRIKADGTEDSSFGDNGRLITQMFDASIDYGSGLNKLLLQADHKILALGGSGNSTLPSGTSLATIARYNADGITALKELPPSNTSISVYPNPSVGTFQLLHSPILQSLQLYDLQGRLLKQWDKPNAQNIFDIAEFTPALYILRINTNDNSHLFTKLNFVR